MAPRGADRPTMAFERRDPLSVTPLPPPPPPPLLPIIAPMPDSRVAVLSNVFSHTNDDDDDDNAEAEGGVKDDAAAF